MANKLAQIQKRIYIIREKRIMLDSDLAELYEVEAKRLNEAVKRNIKRFPDDFMFRLTKEEFAFYFSFLPSSFYRLSEYRIDGN
jgi:hypothetical protein